MVDETLKQELTHMRQLATMLLERAERLEKEIDAEFSREIWISVEETSVITKIPRSTLNRYALQGTVEAKKVGKFWRFPKSRVLDMTFANEEASQGR